MPPLPPAPQLVAQWAWSVALVSVALGVLLTVWGDKYHRAALAIVGGGVGALLGVTLAPYLGMSSLAGQIAIPMVLAVLAVIGAQFVWAIVAACLGLAGAGWILACFFAQTETRAAAAADVTDLTAWARMTWQFARSGMTDAWRVNGLVVILAMFPAGAVPLIVGLFKPKLVTVAMTVLLGAVGAVFGAILGLAQINTSLWSQSLAQPGILVAAVGALITLGVICQYRRILAENRMYGRIDEDDDDEPLPAPSGKGKKRRKNARRGE